jgi:hypothetical protein
MLIVLNNGAQSTRPTQPWQLSMSKEREVVINVTYGPFSGMLYLHHEKWYVHH